MKVLVSGSKGFIGSHTCNFLKERGVNFRVLDKPKDNLLHPIRKSEKFDAFLHLANIMPHSDKDLSFEDCLKNLKMTFNALNFSINAGSKKFVLASSMSVYGFNAKGKISENRAINLDSYYALSKRLCENLVEFYCKAHKMKYVILRYSNVYGPMSRRGFVNNSIKKALAAKEIVFVNHATDVIFAKDVALANFLALKFSGNGLFNIGSGKSVSRKTILKNTLRLTKSKSKTKIVKKIGGTYSANLFTVKKILGFSPKYTLNEGLIETILFYKKSRAFEI